MSRAFRNQRKNLLAIGVYTALAVALSWPLLIHLDTHILGDQSHPGLKGDLFYLYALERKLDAGAEGGLLHTTLLGFPDGIQVTPRVTYSLHLGIYLPLVGALDTFAGRNIAILLFLVLNGFAMHLLAREPWGRPLWSAGARTGAPATSPNEAALNNELFAYMAGLLYAFGPYTFLKLQQGFTQKVVLFLIPLALLYLFRFLRTGRSTALAACWVSLLGVLLAYPPYAFFTILLGAPLVLMDQTLRQRTRELRYRVIAASALMAVLFGLVAVSLWGEVSHPMTIDRYDYQRLGGFLDLLHPFRWYPYAHNLRQIHCDQIPTLRLGLPILVTLLAVLGAAVRVSGTRVPTVWALFSLLVMAGPFLCLGDCDSPGVRLIKLPFYYLGQLPLSNVLKFPIRMYPLVLIALLFGAGRTLVFVHGRFGHRISRWGIPLMAFVLGIVVIENRVVFPEYGRFIVEEARIPSFYREHRGDHVALHLPVRPSSFQDYHLVSALSHHSLVNGGIDGPSKIRLPPAGASPSEKEQFVQRLRSWGVEFIVVHLDAYAQAPHPSSPEGGYEWLEQFCGPADVHEQDSLAVFYLDLHPSG